MWMSVKRLLNKTLKDSDENKRTNKIYSNKKGNLELRRAHEA